MCVFFNLHPNKIFSACNCLTTFTFGRHVFLPLTYVECTVQLSITYNRIQQLFLLYMHWLYVFLKMCLADSTNNLFPPFSFFYPSRTLYLSNKYGIIKKIPFKQSVILLWSSLKIKLTF